MSVAVDDAESWFKIEAKETRQRLLEEADKLSISGQLFRIDKLGNREDMSKEDFVRGKVSASVRRSALLKIANPLLVKKANF
jgi:hypothetical protein